MTGRPANQDELSAHVDRAANKEETAWDTFVAAWLAFIEVAPDPGIQRLMVEAPAVLGDKRWQEIDGPTTCSPAPAQLLGRAFVRNHSPSRSAPRRCSLSAQSSGFSVPRIVG